MKQEDRPATVGIPRVHEGEDVNNWVAVPTRKETRVVRDGDYRTVYDNDFGAKIDAVAPQC
ncbi:hypothetical protein AB0G05_37240 [Nonomuraea wenchangensis]